MAKMHIKQILAKNLQAAIEARYREDASQSEMARHVQGSVSQKTVGNYVKANKYKTGDPEIESLHAPTLSRLAILAEALNVEAWELLRPDPSWEDESTEEAEQNRLKFQMLQHFEALNPRDRARVARFAKGLVDSAEPPESTPPMKEELERPPRPKTYK